MSQVKKFSLWPHNVSIDIHNIDERDEEDVREVRVRNGLGAMRSKETIHGSSYGFVVGRHDD